MANPILRGGSGRVNVVTAKITPKMPVTAPKTSHPYW